MIPDRLQNFYDARRKRNTSGRWLEARGREQWGPWWREQRCRRSAWAPLLRRPKTWTWLWRHWTSAERRPRWTSSERRPRWTSKPSRRFECKILKFFVNKFQCLIKHFGVPTYLSGFVCAFHPATLGLTPKHTIYAFIVYSQTCALFVLVLWKKRKINEKEAVFGPFKKHYYSSTSWAVVVAQFVRQPLLKPEIRGSNPVMGTFIYYQLYWICIEETTIQFNYYAPSH